jgi:ectoine hydroxylase-related dioxygenase (phytanoyl-CoA dioxygenase family)
MLPLLPNATFANEPGTRMNTRNQWYALPAGCPKSRRCPSACCRDQDESVSRSKLTCFVFPQFMARQVGRMLRTHVQYGLPPEFRLPVAIEEIGDSDGESFGSYSRLLKRYEEIGYVIVRKLVPLSLCDEVVAAFSREVKPFGGSLLRQATARLGPHLFTPDGHMANALLSVHELVEPCFQDFRNRAIDVIASRRTQLVAGELLAGAPLLVESMYFESTLIGVPLHADGDYMDSDVRGAMLGAWFALEDIAPFAGRFVLVPRSHTLDKGTSGAALAYREFRNRQAVTSATITTDMKANIKRRLEEATLLHRAVSDAGLSVVAPMLNKGDAVFWSAGLVHGSLPPETRRFSRNSLTAHYIADTQALMIHSRRVDFSTETHHGMKLRMTPNQQSGQPPT